MNEAYDMSSITQVGGFVKNKAVDRVPILRQYSVRCFQVTIHSRFAK